MWIYVIYEATYSMYITFMTILFIDISTSASTSGDKPKETTVLPDVIAGMLKNHYYRIYCYIHITHS